MTLYTCEWKVFKVTNRITLKSTVRNMTLMDITSTMHCESTVMDKTSGITCETRTETWFKQGESLSSKYLSYSNTLIFLGPPFLILDFATYPDCLLIWLLSSLVLLPRYCLCLFALFIRYWKKNPSDFFVLWFDKKFV